MKKIEFFMSFEPPVTTHQQRGIRLVIPKAKAAFAWAAARTGNPYAVLNYAIPCFFEKKKVQDARDLFTLHLKAFRPDEPIEEPVRLLCEWVFPWRKSERKSVTRAFEAIAKTTKPDVGNSNKLLVDCMTDLGFWKDDSVIYEETARKLWGSEPGIFIRIEHGAELGAVRENELL